MTDLQKDLAEAEAKVFALKRQIAQGPCLEFGHDWKHIGGRNAGCREDGCGCSIPVHECTKCGDCDYGDNPEAHKTVAECEANTDG